MRDISVYQLQLTGLKITIHACLWKEPQYSVAMEHLFAKDSALKLKKTRILDKIINFKLLCQTLYNHPMLLSNKMGICAPCLQVCVI